MEKFGLGLLKSPYDPRDYQFKALVGAAAQEYPEEFIPDYKVKLFNQGQTSMCCACATAMSRYIYELTDSGNVEMTSPAYIYGNRCKSTVEQGVYEGEGMYAKDALKQLKAKGVCKLETLNTFGDYS